MSTQTTTPAVESASTQGQQSAPDPEVVIIGAPLIRSDPEARGRKGALINSGNVLSHAFLITLVLGIVAEFFGSIWLPVVAMLVYFVFGVTRPKTHKSTEQFADSLYYLGFILTLGALFFAMSPGFQPGEITSRNIIEKFGIAILTTFVGMTLRIILIQMRQTVTDQEEEARESIALYVSNLQDEMKKSVESLHAFREEALQSVRNATSGFTEGVRKNLETIDLPTDIFSASLRATADALTKEVEGLRTSVAMNAASLNSSLTETTELISKTQTSLGALVTFVSNANERMTKAAEASTSNGEAFANAAKNAATSVSEIRSEAAALAALLQRLRSVLDERGEKYADDMRSAAEQVRGTTNELANKADAFSATLIGSAKQIRDAIVSARR